MDGYGKNGSPNPFLHNDWSLSLPRTEDLKMGSAFDEEFDVVEKQKMRLEKQRRAHRPAIVGGIYESLAMHADLRLSEEIPSQMETSRRCTARAVRQRGRQISTLSIARQAATLRIGTLPVTTKL